jgi:gluconolactonase
MDVIDLLESPEITQVATGLKFTEGPLWHPDGYLLFTDVGGPWRIWKVVPGQDKQIYRDDTGRATGLTFDLHGNIIACEQAARAVTSMDADGNITAIATQYDGKRLNRPNDVVGRSDGSLYFSNRGVGGMDGEDADFEHPGVYRIAPDGTVHEEVYPYEDPNGLAISPDEKTYYQINTRPSAHIDAFDIAMDGSLSNQRRFFTFPESDRPGFPDGMKVDSEGRVYVSGPGGLWVLTPDGESIGVVEFPEQVINMAWGDSDNQTLYVAAMTSIYSIRFNTPGLAIPRANT